MSHSRAYPINRAGVLGCLLLCIGGCYASRGGEMVDARAGSDAPDAPDAPRVLDAFHDEARDARDLRDASDASDAADAAAPDVPPDAPPPPVCEPAVWITPEPFACGRVVRPRFEAVNVDGPGLDLSAGSCGLAMVVGHANVPIGATSGSYDGYTVRLVGYDSRVLWEHRTPTETWRDPVALPNGDVVVQVSNAWDAVFASYGFAGERWRYAPAEGRAMNPVDADVDSAGVFHAYVSSDRPSTIGLLDSGESVVADVTFDADGRATPSELGRFPIPGPEVSPLYPTNVMRYPDDSLLVRAHWATRWIDGTTTPDTRSLEGPWHVRIEDGIVTDTRLGVWNDFLIPYPDGDVARLRVEDHWRRMRMGRLGPTGEVRWERIDRFSSYPTIGEIYVYRSVARPDGRLLLGGRADGTVEWGGEAHVSSSGGDAVLAEIDPCGQLLWVRYFTTSSIQDLTLRPDGAVVASLLTGGPVDVEGTVVGDPSFYWSAMLTISDGP